MPRFYCPSPLQTGDALDLPPGPARHVQVLRMQPGQTITLFNHGPGWDGVTQAATAGGEYEAEILLMGRSQVQVRVGAFKARECEAARRVSIAVVMPANERMDWLVEKATELGVASIYPLTSERSVLRLSGERADKKIAHWQAVAIAACEQCGANQVPRVHAVQSLPHFFRDLPATTLSEDAIAPARLLLRCMSTPSYCAIGLEWPARKRCWFCLAPKVDSAMQKKPWRCKRALYRSRWVRAPCAQRRRL